MAIEKTQLVPEDIFEEMYIAFANLLVADPYIQNLLSDNSYVFDFLPFEGIKAVYTKPPLSTIPQDAPHIQLAINRMSFSPINTCANQGEINMTLAYESPMHQESTYKVASYLSTLLARKAFACLDRTVRVMSSSAQFTYNAAKHSTSVQQDILLQFDISARR
jgi:hypothetical protein